MSHWWSKANAGAGDGSVHLWSREPHVDTPALCGEWKNDKVTRPMDQHPLVMSGKAETLEEWVLAMTGAICEECRETARERYGFTS